MKPWEKKRKHVSRLFVLSLGSDDNPLHSIDSHRSNGMQNTRRDSSLSLEVF